MPEREKIAHMARVNADGKFEIVDLMRAPEEEAEGHFRVTLEDGQTVLIPVIAVEPFVFPNEVTPEHKAQIEATWNTYYQAKESPAG